MYKSWSMHDAFYKGLAPSDNMLICLDKRSFGYSDAGCVRNKRKYIYIYQDVSMGATHHAVSMLFKPSVVLFQPDWTCRHFLELPSLHFSLLQSAPTHIWPAKNSVSVANVASPEKLWLESYTRLEIGKGICTIEGGIWAYSHGKGPKKCWWKKFWDTGNCNSEIQFHAANLCIASMWLQAYETQSLFPSSWLLHLGTLDIHKKNVEILSAASNTVGRRLKA